MRRRRPSRAERWTPWNAGRWALALTAWSCAIGSPLERNLEPTEPGAASPGPGRGNGTPGKDAGVSSPRDAGPAPPSTPSPPTPPVDDAGAAPGLEAGTPTPTPTPPPTPPPPPPPPPPPVGPAEALFARRDATCALRQGVILCWGVGDHDIDAVDDPDDPILQWPAPTAWPKGAPVGKAASLALGSLTTCAVSAYAPSAGGGVVCWGQNVAGSLGNGSTSGGVSPSTVVALTDAVQVAGDATFFVALRATGDLVWWGDWLQGGQAATPTAIAGVTQVRKVAVGDDHYCALTKDGSVVCAGNGAAIGSGGTPQTTPTPVTGLPSSVDIAASHNTTCAVSAVGEVYCWGRRINSIGSSALTAEQVPGITSAVSLGLDRYHACVARADGSAWCWGKGSAGQLGRGTTVADGPPAPVSNLADVVQVTAGSLQSCARTRAGRVYCWGDRDRVGNASATGTAVTTPVLVDTF